MPRTQLAENLLRIVLFTALVLIFSAFIPYGIATSKSSTVIAGLEKFRQLGQLLMVVGVVGYLLCFRNFLIDAQGSPIPWDSQKLIVKGLYRYVRNPMYISACFIFLGEAIYFEVLESYYYLFGWFAVFNMMVFFVEEPFLRKNFGDQYEHYCKSVRRWIPRLNPYDTKGR